MPAFDTDAAFDSDASFEPGVTPSLRIKRSRYFVPGATLLAQTCFPDRICDSCGEPTVPIEPPSGECSLAVSQSVTVTCPVFDPDCIPVWFIEHLIAVYGPCSGPAYESGGLIYDICNGTNTSGENENNVWGGAAVNFVCCYLTCFAQFIDRIGHETCLTYDSSSVQSHLPECESAWQWLRKQWFTYGREYLAFHCLGFPLPNRPLKSSLFASYRSIVLPRGSYKIDDECVTIGLDSSSCEACL